jgi:predicted phosphodiesterase
VRSLILADVHANLEALNAVLADARDRGGFDEIWCLGDTVGYGPDPNACLELLRGRHLVMVAGNHDFAAVNKLCISNFNPAAQASTQWTSAQLSRDGFDFLAALPLTVTTGDFTLVHGSLKAPLTEYLLNAGAALDTFAVMATPYGLVGHSHIPFICEATNGDATFLEFFCDAPTPLGDTRCIINPGGVGQPRDLDPRPSYAIYDSRANTIQRFRVVYEIAETQSKMRQAGLPLSLIERLDYGR